MKRIWTDLVGHIKTDFNPRTYGLMGLFIAALIFVNYYFEFERKLWPKLDAWNYLWLFVLHYPLVYYISVWIKLGSKPFKDKRFLAVSAFYVIILAINCGFTFYREWTVHLPVYEKYYMRGLLANGLGSFIIFIPLIGIYLFSERKHMSSFYGLTFRKHNFWPYAVLLILMVPLIFWASTNADFLRTYPTLKIWKYQEVYGLTKAQMMGLYEFIYLFDFIRVETIFRGALIIGLARFLGKDTILVMATLYCVLHFNKPLGETISSIFGGYLLGTIAYYQKNIVGGCMVHAGIAGLMELIAYYAHGI